MPSISRHQMVKRLGEGQFDLLIIGGGITGAGVAQDAAHRGLRVALVEKGDFGSGTSHASTKLLHGGLRYLEQFQLKLMYEALHERNRMTRLAPHLAQWLPFLIPIYGRGWKMERMGIGLWLYDLLAGLPKGHLHRRISREEALKMAPYLDADGLRGAYLYYDARTNDTRLTVEVLQSALDAGAAAANYCMVQELMKDNGKVLGAVVRDQVTGHTFTVRAKAVVAATGAWTDSVMDMDQESEEKRLRPSKGVHVVVPASRLPVDSAVLAPSPTGDGRFIFVVPWEGAVLLGTTDTPFPGDPDKCEPEEADIQYILDSANATFPTAKLTRADVLSAMAGLRPLLNAKASSTASLPREHKLWVNPESGLISIAGGKLTTYRTMAAEVTDAALKVLGRPMTPCKTGDIPLGTRRPDIMANLIRQHPDLAEPLIPGLPHTRAEVAFAAMYEMAVTVDDVLKRRTRLFYLDQANGAPQREAIAALIRRFGEFTEAKQPAVVNQ